MRGCEQSTGIKQRNDKEDHEVDAVATILTLEPFKVGIGIGAIALIYGTVKMELSLGVLGFFLCFLAGMIAQLFK
jgi:hypothetical protein